MQKELFKLAGPDVRGPAATAGSCRLRLGFGRGRTQSHSTRNRCSRGLAGFWRLNRSILDSDALDARPVPLISCQAQEGSVGLIRRSLRIETRCKRLERPLRLDGPLSIGWAFVATKTDELGLEIACKRSASRHLP